VDSVGARPIETPTHGYKFPGQISLCSLTQGSRLGEEVKVVAKPNPDRSLLDGELAAFADADGANEVEVAYHHKDDSMAVNTEMLRRWFHFHQHHDDMQLCCYHHDEQEEEAEPAKGLKQFHQHLHKVVEEKDMMMRKRSRHAEPEHDDDSVSRGEARAAAVPSAYVVRGPVDGCFLVC
jgi:hypothetical protein